MRTYPLTDVDVESIFRVARKSSYRGGRLDNNVDLYHIWRCSSRIFDHHKAWLV